MSTVTFSSSNGGVLTRSILNARLGSATMVMVEGYTSVASEAFAYNPQLISVTFSNSLTSIGNSAFQSCSNLTSVTLGNSLTSIGNSVFQLCSNLTSVIFPDSLTSIGNSVFQECVNLTSVTLGNSLTSINQRMFYECSKLISVIIPNSVTSIGEFAFANCASLTLVIIPNSVTSIGEYAFYGCSGIISLTLGNSVTSIGFKAFYGLIKLPSVIIPNSVTSIGVYAFSECHKLTSVTLGNSLTSIGSSAFSNCIELKTVIVRNQSTITVSDDSFRNVSSTIGSSITFNNTGSYNNLSSTWKTISTYFKTQVYPPSPIKPVITFPEINAKYGDSFTISYISNSSGSVTFTCSDTSIATINGSTITFVGVGRAIITATQSETDSFQSKTTTCSLTVVKSNPIIRNVIHNFVNNESQISFDSTSSGTYSYTFSDNSAVKINPNNTFTFLKNCSVIVTIHQDETPGYFAADFSSIINHP